jgi:glycosyltransferase involved in cell wall biosynthesis
LTAIRQIELSAPLAPLAGLAPYDRCMVVFRWHGRVVGRAFVPVTDDIVPVGALNRAIQGPVAREALSCWLDEQLGRDERVILGATSPTATVVICTRERPDDLRRALTALTALRHEGHELLVVDNAPASDATSQVVASYPGVRYVVERVRGLNAARNRALREARGDVVAFTDDDALPEPEWLGALLPNFSDRQVSCVTGLTLPLELETEAQELFEQHCTFVRGFRRRVFDATADSPLAVGPVGAGANMAVRRRAILDLGGFDERLDAGMPTRSGGDHEMFTRILLGGRQIVYDPAAVSWHRHRRTSEELLDTVYGYGVGVYAMWTGLVLERGEITVLRLAWQWLRHGQVPALLGRDGRGRAAARLARAELRGCLHGPRAWFAARRLRAAEA